MTEKSADDLRFFGKVTASVTHDLQNVIAVIKETAGLMEDILLMNRDKELPFLEKFQKSLSTIKNQSLRGSSLVKSLNEFAHTPDDDEKEIDIVKTARMLTTLIERKTKSSEIHVHVEEPEGLVVIRTNAIKFEMALLTAIESILQGLPKGSTLKITPEKSDQAIIVRIACKDLPNDPSTGDPVKKSGQEGCLDEILKTINGHAETDDHFKGIILSFSSR